MAGPGAIVTVASQEFRYLQSDDVYDPNYDVVFGFQRAIKVFYMSFPEFNDQSLDIYQQKFENYFNCMANLFDLQVIDRQFLTQIKNSLTHEIIELTVGIIRLKAGHQLNSPRVEVSTGFSQSTPIDLDTNSEIQMNARHRRQLPFELYRQLRTENKQIRITLSDGNVNNFKEFQINYQEIHCEGFQDWFDFGNGSELLIKIEFSVNSEPTVSPEMVSNFHFYAINYMCERRVVAFRNISTTGHTGHRQVAHKRKVSYIREKVVKNTDECFWGTPTQMTDMLANIRSVRLTGRADKSRQNIKLDDLQIPYEFEEIYETNVCLCSEWCNWNAFFHFNPIYRFLLIQHNKLYLKNRTTVPDMYLFATALQLCISKATTPVSYTPTLQLMDCANHYRQRLHEMYCFKDQKFHDSYNDSDPSFRKLNGLSYNWLRDEIPIHDLCFQIDANPFSDSSMDGFKYYYKTLTELHKLMTCINEYIDGADEREWHKELDQISRKAFPLYIREGYQKIITNEAINYDYLFSEDYEYSSRVVSDENELKVQNIRSNIYKKSLIISPLNLRVIVNEMVFSYTSVLKFFQVLNPVLPSPDSLHSQHDIYKSCKHLETDFNTYFTNNQKVFDFQIPNEVLTERQLIGFEKGIVIFYTLKLYFIAFGIQSTAIKSLLDYNRRLKVPAAQPCNEFTFIFKTDLIEQKFRNDYPNEVLFDVRDTEILNVVREFYQDYWGRSAHERQANNQNLTYEECLNSAFFEYQRLFYWIQNNGQKKFKFRRIFDTFQAILTDSTNRCEEIYNTYIGLYWEPLFQPLTYSTEAIDVLVYYLVKANCSVILSTISSLLKRAQQLQNARLIRKNGCFFLSKPGWVRMLRTYKRAIRSADRLKVSYISFDDEFNRIDNTLTQTLDLIKNIYKDFYRKTVSVWIEELNELYDYQNADQSHCQLLAIHLAVGQSFLAAFVNDFRKIFNTNRNFYKDLLDNPPDPNFPQQDYLNSCEPACDAYLRDGAQLWRKAQPFQTNIWRNHLIDVFTQFDANDGQTVRVDLALADI